MPIVWTDVPEANQLLETDHLALLIGLVLDQQVKMEKAFRGPYDLKQRLGGLGEARGELAYRGRCRFRGVDGARARGETRDEGRQVGQSDSPPGAPATPAPSARRPQWWRGGDCLIEFTFRPGRRTRADSRDEISLESR